MRQLLLDPRPPTRHSMKPSRKMWRTAPSAYMPGSPGQNAIQASPNAYATAPNHAKLQTIVAMPDPTAPDDASDLSAFGGIPWAEALEGQSPERDFAERSGPLVRQRIAALEGGAAEAHPVVLGRPAAAVDDEVDHGRDDVVFLRPDTIQCPRADCYFINDGRSLFSDDNHLSRQAVQAPSGGASPSRMTYSRVRSPK